MFDFEELLKRTASNLLRFGKWLLLFNAFVYLFRGGMSLFVFGLAAHFIFKYAEKLFE